MYINKIESTGEYPLNTKQLFSSLEKAGYKKDNFYLNEVKDYINIQNGEIDVFKAFPEWKDSNNAYWGDLVALTALYLKK
jgi:hypothetical protein